VHGSLAWLFIKANPFMHERVWGTGTGAREPRFPLQPHPLRTDIIIHSNTTKDSARRPGPEEIPTSCFTSRAMPMTVAQYYSWFRLLFVVAGAHHHHHILKIVFPAACPPLDWSSAMGGKPAGVSGSHDVIALSLRRI